MTNEKIKERLKTMAEQREALQIELRGEALRSAIWNLRRTTMSDDAIRLIFEEEMKR